MNELTLLIDGSVNAQSKLGYGAYLVMSDPELAPAELKARVRVRRFEQTSSTRLELQTLLWALSEIQNSGRKLMILTDSQHIIGLPERRERLEKNDYRSRTNKRLNNYRLYQEFYRLTDQLDYELVKIRGHQPAKHKDKLDELFTLVDRAARKALRDALC